ncbi:MAG: 2OG-Fe(II) oxygenase [Alphaproteobacteria bacterium]
MITINFFEHRIKARNTSGTTEDNWLAKPQTVPPSFLNIYPDVISPEICKEVIARFNQDSRVTHSKTQGNDNPSDRKGQMLGIGILPEWQEISAMIQQAIEERIHHYAETYLSFKRVLMTDKCVLTPLQLERIDPGQGFDWHSDASTPETNNRVLATILYLADISSGGQTQFAFQMSGIQPQAGSLLLFPPFWTHLHRGETPAQGTKYNLTNFVIQKR